MGVGDEVPAAIEQLGAKVEMIGADDLAWGDLSRFNTIVTGVRAYERRDDLRANNSRLLEYVRERRDADRPVQPFEFNEAQYGPYPAQVSNDRVTDEHAPVDDARCRRIRCSTTPNKITDAAWAGWVQERGLYFLGEKDSRYRDLVQLDDPFPEQPGREARRARRGAVRQGPVDLRRARARGASCRPASTARIRLLANLISLGTRTALSRKSELRLQSSSADHRSIDSNRSRA